MLMCIFSLGLLKNSNAHFFYSYACFTHTLYPFFSTAPLVQRQVLQGWQGHDHRLYDGNVPIRTAAAATEALFSYLHISVKIGQSFTRLNTKGALRTSATGGWPCLYQSPHVAVQVKQDGT